MATAFPTQAKLVLDPDTSDIDPLIFLASAELRDACLEVVPGSVATRLGIPSATVEQHWHRLEPMMRLGNPTHP